LGIGAGKDTLKGTIMAEAEDRGEFKINRAAAVVDNPGGGEKLVTLDVSGKNGDRYAPSVPESVAKATYETLKALFEK
jgi:hypothetical protein